MTHDRLLYAAAEVLECLRAASIPACVIGGLAVLRWGEPRATRDVDLSVLAPYGEERRALDALLARFSPRRPDARDFALSSRVLLLRTTVGPEADVALAAYPFELEAISRATTWCPLPEVCVLTCPAEHLLVYKLVAARPRDLLDIEGIVLRQASRLDVDAVRRWGQEFAELKEDPDLLRPFEDALRRSARR